ncbi:cell division protein ZapA [Elstera litoralis]|nr:cell division protein ZapA [Elstera litoralis]
MSDARTDGGNTGMPDLDIVVNGRTYRVACGPGEEERLRALAGEVDNRISGLVRSFGQVGEAQLLLVAALLLADELDENRASQQRLQGLDERAADALHALADRIEQLAGSLEHA